MSKLIDKNILIVGAGISGISAAKLCCSEGAKVYIYDQNNVEKLIKESSDLKKCIYVSDLNLKMLLKKINLAVLSPSILLNTKVGKLIAEQGIEAISEIELGYRYCRGKIIAITGTNGKTSTAKLCNEMFELQNFSHGMYGNMGIGFAERIKNTDEKQITILELSAQQLQFSNNFHPYISVITNIKPEHQVNYPEFEIYFKDKIKILKNQTKKDICILNYTDEECKKAINFCRAKVLWFCSKGKILDEGAYYYNKKIYLRIENKEIFVFDNKKGIVRQDYIEHALILVLIAYIFKLNIEYVIKKIFEKASFEHRLEVVMKYKNRTFINDSKATNPYSTIFAIETNENVILICGSNNKKKNDFTELAEKIVQKVKFVVLYGETASIISEKLIKMEYFKYVIAENLQESVRYAYNHADQGDNIIFSPGGNCSPTFDNYYERGKIFKNIVKNEMFHSSLDNMQ